MKMTKFKDILLYGLFYGTIDYILVIVGVAIILGDGFFNQLLFLLKNYFWGWIIFIIVFMFKKMYEKKLK